jgi:hypothetical protein
MQSRHQFFSGSVSRPPLCLNPGSAPACSTIIGGDACGMFLQKKKGSPSFGLICKKLSLVHSWPESGAQGDLAMGRFWGSPIPTPDTPHEPEYHGGKVSTAQLINKLC